MAFPSSNVNPANAIPVWIAPTPASAGANTNNITTATSTLVKTGAGALTGLIVATAGTGATATVYNGISAGGTLIGTFSLNAQGAINMPGSGIPFSVGLFIVTVGSPAANLIVTYF